MAIRLLAALIVVTPLLVLGARAQETPTCTPAQIPQSVSSVPPLNDVIATLRDELRTVDDCVAVAQLERIAALGNVNAVVLMGDTYARGIVVPVDGPKAISYYEEALALGQRSVLVRMGD